MLYISSHSFNLLLLLNSYAGFMYLFTSFFSFPVLVLIYSISNIQLLVQDSVPIYFFFKFFQNIFFLVILSRAMVTAWLRRLCGELQVYVWPWSGAWGGVHRLGHTPWTFSWIHTHSGSTAPCHRTSLTVVFNVTTFVCVTAFLSSGSIYIRSICCLTSAGVQLRFPSLS